MNGWIRVAIPLAVAVGAAALSARLRQPPARPLPSLQLSERGPRPRIVVLGGGFGGLSAAIGVAQSAVDVDIILVDQHNYHLFTPLLYQVAVGVVDANNITYPLRALAYENGIRFVLGEAQGFDVAGKQLLTSAGPIAYDYLVVALGSVTNFYGQTEVAERALPLKTIADAEAIHNTILGAFEYAESEGDPERRRRLLTFPIVGGGPTGIELAGAVSALVGDVAGREYPDINAHDVDIQLIEAAGQILGMMQPAAQKIATDQLRERGVEIRLNSSVSGVAGSDFMISDHEHLQTEALIWAAGVRGHPLLEHLPGEKTRDHRIQVDEHLRIAEHPEIFVIGDSAAFIPAAKAEKASRPLPGTAPVAIQEGRRTAQNIVHLLRGEAIEPFVYRHQGNLVALGRHAAVAEVMGRTFDGLPAWLLWRAVHLSWLTGLRNRLQVLLDWSLIYLGPRQTEWMRSAARHTPRLLRNGKSATAIPSPEAA